MRSQWAFDSWLKKGTAFLQLMIASEVWYLTLATCNVFFLSRYLHNVHTSTCGLHVQLSDINLRYMISHFLLNKAYYLIRPEVIVHKHGLRNV